MGKVKWTENASKNLKHIYEYIAKDSEIYATHFVKSLICATDKLETFPKCGRIVPELEEYGFREVIYQNYRIVYRIIEIKDGKEVEILAVVHGARDMTKVVNDEWRL
ncbi:MAG TPA: type II toxin-antitoxin system RelE/ParE family toxin [Methanophagales archaeon]|nr:type II toxin-antitoxin system RelE/ParE family toxin [Methanophagales archaeon]